MNPTVIFVHGTTIRDVDPYVAHITDGLERIAGWSSPKVVGVPWGVELAPPPRPDLAPVLPPRYTSRGVDADPVAQWGLLTADPEAELRIVAVVEPVAATPGSASADLAERLAGLRLSDDVLRSAGVTQDEITAAARRIAPSAAMAADRTGSADAVTEPVARAVVASVLNAAAITERPVAISYDGAKRDVLVQAVHQALGISRGPVADHFKKVFGDIATHVGVHERLTYMNPLTHFIADIAYYLQHGEELRTYLADQMAGHVGGEGAVVLGHSLGGIACVDLLSDPSSRGDQTRSLVKLFVTAGSQAPYLYLMDALEYLRPVDTRRPPPPQLPRKPFTPWLNVYNDDDLLSFCAARVFGPDSGIVDAAVDPGVPFPASHGAYWSCDAVYALIRDHLRQLPVRQANGGRPIPVTE